MAVSNCSPTTLLFVFDKCSNMKYLVDTGSDISVIPKTSSFQHKHSSFKLFAANGSQINTYGQKLLRIDLGLKREFPFVFIIADVDKPIIGADFLAKFHLLVDVKNKSLLDNITKLKAFGSHYTRVPTRVFQQLV